MRITDLYKTNITYTNVEDLKLVEYTILMDGVEHSIIGVQDSDLTVTVSLSDFNGEPVRGKSATITCVDGYFYTSRDGYVCNGETKKYTGTTNENGKFTIFYSNEKFTVDILTCNEANARIDMTDTGWVMANNLVYDENNGKGFSNWESNPLKYRRRRDVVEVTGGLKVSKTHESNMSHIMYYLPHTCVPSEKTSMIQQASNAYKYHNCFYPSGSVTLERYNDGTSISVDVPNNAWLISNHIFTTGGGIPRTNRLLRHKLDDSIIPKAFEGFMNAPHSFSYGSISSPVKSTYFELSYDNNTGNNLRYYMLFPFKVEGDFEINVVFSTIGFDNDDFGIRFCDKRLADTGTFNSMGMWVLTGQHKLAFGYGTGTGVSGLEARSNLYFGQIERNPELSNDKLYHATIRVRDSMVYFNIYDDPLVDGGYDYDNFIRTRSDDFSFSGDYYLYIGGGKFSDGADNKKVRIYYLEVRQI